MSAEVSATPRFLPEAYPHIVEKILENCSTAEIFSLRAATRGLKNLVDKKLYRHVVISGSHPNPPAPVWVPLTFKVGMFDYWVWSHPEYDLPGRYGPRFKGSLQATRVLSVNGHVRGFHPDVVNGLTEIHTMRLIANCCGDSADTPFRPDNLVVITAFNHHRKPNRSVCLAKLPAVAEGVKSLVITVGYIPQRYAKYGGLLDPLREPQSLRRAVIIFKPSVPGDEVHTSPSNLFPNPFGWRPRVPGDILDSLLMDIARTLPRVRYTLVAPPPPPGDDENDDQDAGDGEDEDEATAEAKMRAATIAYYNSLRHQVVELVVELSELSRSRAEAAVERGLEVIGMETYIARVGPEQFKLETEL